MCYLLEWHEIDKFSSYSTHIQVVRFYFAYPALESGLVDSLLVD